ncbi:hypothetical protein CKO51_29295 [Rhodopirellula sp. SM50]|nr:hypothetical protein CKO51_29295 [Rhodopirellula sp. SM50]
MSGDHGFSSPSLPSPDDGRGTPDRASRLGPDVPGDEETIDKPTSMADFLATWFLSDQPS